LPAPWATPTCRQRFRTRYYRVPRLLGDLELARADGSHPNFLGRLASLNLPILDDWGLATLTAPEARRPARGRR